MASILASHLGKVTDIRIVSVGGSGNIDEARNHIDFTDNNGYQWWEQDVHFNHVWVEFKWNSRWYCIDSDGIRTRREMYRRWGTPCNGTFTAQEMKELANDMRGWNYMFARNQIPSMKNFIGRRFNKLYREMGVLSCNQK